MQLTFGNRPVGVLCCLLWSIVAVFFILFDVFDPLRILLAISMILFIPGYLLISAVFPEKTEKNLDVVDRIALSIGISIAIAPLFGIALFYLPWGLTLQPLIFSLEIFILLTGTIAIIRWYRTPAEKRYTSTLVLSRPTDKTKFDKALTMMFVFLLILAIFLFVYVGLTPKSEQHFTEFYVLRSDHVAYDYPLNLTVNESATVILGIVNHESIPMNYTIEVWLSNQTTQFNTSSKRNETIYHHLWFIDKINITLPNQPIDLTAMTTTQWESNYTFHFNHSGHFKLIFLLYISPTPHYSKTLDYRMLAVEKADNDHTTAYRDLYLWVNIQ